MTAFRDDLLAASPRPALALGGGWEQRRGDALWLRSGGRWLPLSERLEIAGQIIGTAFGLLVPLAQRADLAVSVSVGDMKTIQVMGRF